MKTILGIIGLLAALAVGSVNAQDSIINASGTGTTSATAIVPPAAGIANITDLVALPDSGNSSATVQIRTGKVSKAITTAPSGATTTNGTTVWFANTGSAIVAASGYAILHETGANAFQLVRAAAVTSTNMTTHETISGILDTNDKVYALNTAVGRAVVSETTGQCSIWLPASLPSALTLDGNTTSCKISVSGVRKQ